MKITIEEFQERLHKKGLKVTPQRIAVFEAICGLGNHPTADDIACEVRKVHPNIATGTVYKVLETFVNNNLLRRVKTEKDVMRYECFEHHHHHLYSSKTQRIADYYDDELDKVLTKYFSKKRIPGFNIEEVKLQIIGEFKK